MPTLESLQAKRATLVASLEQFVGQINRINGAIAVLDELIGEEQSRQDALVQEEYARMDREAAEQVATSFGGIDRSPSSHWGSHEGEAAAPDAPSVVPEMLPPAPHQMMPITCDELVGEENELLDPEMYLAPRSDAA